MSRERVNRLVATVIVLGIGAAAQPPALPQVSAPFAGDPRLEALPSAALTLADYPVWSGGIALSMRFPPRVNGQTQSDGDGSADLYVLFYSDNGERVSQPVLLEAAPRRAGVAVSNGTARSFSSVWRVHAALVSRGYNPADLGQRIDSVAKLAGSAFLVSVYSTNLHLNAPAAPAGSVSPPPGAALVDALHDGQTLLLAPAGVADGVLPPQVLFKFEDPGGNTLPSSAAPHLVASRKAGEFFFSPNWEVWTVRVPAGFDVTQLRSRAQFLNASGVPVAPFSVRSSGIRLNAPVSAVNGSPVPADDVFNLLTGALGRFEPTKFPFDVPASQFEKQRTFAITAVASSLAAPNPPAWPRIDPGGRGNVIPIILRNPFQTAVSAPNATGPYWRIDQAELDTARLSNPPRLPASIEANIALLVATGLLPADWSPGARPYVERLALVGRALHEMTYRPEDGANVKDVTSCFACHTRPKAGGGGRALFNLSSGTSPAVNAGSFWGSGAAELLNALKRAAGETGLTFAHGTTGGAPTLRGFAIGAPDRHFGLQSAEFVAGRTGNPGGFDPVTDLDGDGVVNEKSVGEVTAETVWMMTLPVPDLAPPALRSALGIGEAALASGKQLFRRSIDAGGAGCASCHTVFHRMATTTALVRNPQTASVLAVPLPHHTADADDVADGLAVSIGEAGLRLFGDFRLHKMGALLGLTGTDTLKTAELWDAGSTHPLGRGGEFGSDMRAAILAHEGVPLGAITIFRGAQSNATVDGKPVSTQWILVRNDGASPIPASALQPVRVVLAGTLTPSIIAFNAAAPGPGGSLRHGAVWLISQPIGPGGVAAVQLRFENPGFAALQYELIVQTHAGYSEAAASGRAFRALSVAQQGDLVDFLRAQVVGGSVE